MKLKDVYEVEEWLNKHEDEDKHLCLRITDLHPREGFRLVGIIDTVSRECVRIDNKEITPLPIGVYENARSGKKYFLYGFSRSSVDCEQVLVEYLNLEEGDFAAFSKWNTPLNNFNRKFKFVPSGNF